MEIAKPRCGDQKPHEAHESGLGVCPGWTEQHAQAVALVHTLIQYAREHTPPLEPMPEGIRLEVHPRAYSMLRQIMIPDYGEHMKDESLVPIPVFVSAGLADGEWRLAVSSVISEGKIG